jgi:drug/metabolite transporter (DMT)-like permease
VASPLRRLVATPNRNRALALVTSLLAAFLWANYYLFVLWATPGARPSAVLAYPFIFGGIAYAGWAVVLGHGRHFLRMWAQPEAYVRTGLLVAMQISVLAATYLAGPVDASLLSLIGDVVLTPIVVAYLLGIGRAHVHTSIFAAGLLLSLVGGSLTIVAGQKLSAITSWGWLVVPAVPFAVAFYFLLTARENAHTPPAATVSQSMVAAAVVIVALSPLLPGGAVGLVTVRPVPLLLLALCGVTSFFLAPALYFFALDRAGLIIPPMLMTGIPVFTLLLASGVLGIALPLLGVLGIPIAVGGAVLALRGETETGVLPPDPSPGP